MTYTYREGIIEIIAFADGMVADNQYIDVEGEYDPEIGISVSDGYYVKGW